MIRIILTEIPGHGWLPTVEINDREKFRGEFRHTPEVAAAACAAVLPQLKEAVA